ncbi:MAG: restriction endonuclease subunit S [Gallionella sp.]|nr:restriction endonuclease subunit S [Gallionella sp.]
MLELPNSWAAVKLGDFVENEKGKKPKNESKAETASHSIPYVDIQAFEENVIRTWTDGVGCRLCYETDFLMVWDGSRSGLVGKGMNGALGSTLVRIYFPSMVNDYAFYFLQSKYQQINTRAKGVGIPHVDPALLWNYDFPIAPLNEQHRIVTKIEELFSELDKGIENLKTARAQLKVYRQALLKHAFEGKLTAQWRAENRDKLEPAAALQKRIQQERVQRYQQQLAEWEAAGKQGSKPKAPKPLPPLTAEELAELPELPEGWGWVKLGELTWSVKDGPHFSPKYVEKGIPFISGGNIRPDGVDFDKAKHISIELHEELSKRCKPEIGDVLYTKGGTTGIARVNTFNVDFNVWVHVAVLKLTSIVKPFYLQHALNSSFCYSQSQKYTHGVGNQDLGLTRMVNIVLAICSIDEQVEVIKIVDDKMSVIDQLDQTITTSLQQAEALRQSILKKAFSGQLVAQDVNDEPASVLLARIKTEKIDKLAMAKPLKPKKAQPASDQTNVIPFPVKLANISTTDLHAGILARAYQHHEHTPRYLANFGHVKAEKIVHLVEAHLGIDLEREPVKAAAGPNDFPRLINAESRARKMNWFNVRKQKDGAYVLTKGDKFDALLLKTRNALGERADEVDALINKLLPLNRRQAEIVATLYAAWNNLLLLGRSPSDEDIVFEARENWHDSKLKIERDKFFRGIKWMREQGLVPSGKGRHVSAKGVRETVSKKKPVASVARKTKRKGKPA